MKRCWPVRRRGDRVRGGLSELLLGYGARQAHGATGWRWRPQRAAIERWPRSLGSPGSDPGADNRGTRRYPVCGRSALRAVKRTERALMGGVPAQLVPDNPKVGITRANWYEPG